MTPKELATAAKCYCFDDLTFKAVVAYLLNAISSGGSSSVRDMEVAWTPTNLKLGELIGFVSDPNFSGSPTLPGITTLTFDQATTRAAIDIENASDVVSISFPNLVTVDPTNLQGGYLTFSVNPKLTTLSAPLLTNCGSGLSINNNPLLASISLPVLATSLLDIAIVQNAILTLSLPLLATIGRDFNIELNAALTSVSLPSLVTVSGGVNIDQNAALVTIDLSSFVPTNNKNFNASNSALNAATVNLILHRHVLNAGYVNGIINLGGGTSAAPSGAGIADKATLQGRGVTVNTN